MLAGSTSFGGKFTILGGANDDNLTLGDIANSADNGTRLAINGATTLWEGGSGTNTFSNSLGANLFDNGTPPTNSWV